MIQTTDILTVAEQLGLNHITPTVLGDAGNLIVHLAPYPVVARAAKLFEGDDPDVWQEIWSSELKISRHLSAHGLPVVECTSLVSPGPHPVGDTWMTLWEYIEPAPLPPLDVGQAIGMVADLTSAMSDFANPLPRLGAWRNVRQAASDLRSICDDNRIAELLLAFEKIDTEIQRAPLFPAHGDAHPGNLLPSAAGWHWIDFEDVSRMPKFWDFASFIGNTALFHGLNHPVVEYVLTKSIASSDKESLQFAIKARIIMSTMTNLSLALDGDGDLQFAQSQLDRVNDCLEMLNREFP